MCRVAFPGSGPTLPHDRFSGVGYFPGNLKLYPSGLSDVWILTVLVFLYGALMTRRSVCLKN